MSSATYVLPTKPFLLDEGDADLLAEIPASWFGDYSEPDLNDNETVREFTLADAMAASGDYFITLATRLDKLAQGLQQDSAEQIELEHQVKLLFYMQDHYDLVAKYKNR